MLDLPWSRERWETANYGVLTINLLGLVGDTRKFRVVCAGDGNKVLW